MHVACAVFQVMGRVMAIEPFDALLFPHSPYLALRVLWYRRTRQNNWQISYHQTPPTCSFFVLTCVRVFCNSISQTMRTTIATTAINRNHSRTPTTLVILTERTIARTSTCQRVRIHLMLSTT